MRVCDPLFSLFPTIINIIITDLLLYMYSPCDLFLFFLRRGRNNEAIIAINPGGEETWDRLVSAHGQPNCPFLVMNNAYSTSYDIGNRKGFEEVYYLKRISKGFVYRSFPGDWQALLEKPDGSVEVLKTYKTKPSLREVSELVRDVSFKRYAINNDRWMSGRM